MTRWQAELEQQAGGPRADRRHRRRTVRDRAAPWSTPTRWAASGPSAGEEAYELADLFSLQARRRVDGLFTALWHNDDRAGYEIAQRVLDGRYAWLEQGIL